MTEPQLQPPATADESRILEIAEARDHLADLVDSVQNTYDRVTLTRHGSRPRSSSRPTTSNRSWKPSRFCPYPAL